MSARAAGRPTIMIVAGEASGDLHGALLSRGLRARSAECHLIGMGGARMAAAGVELLADVTGGAVVGAIEAVHGLGPLWRALGVLRAALRGPDRPDVVVLIDFPEFNFLLARAARRAGVPVIYFVPPQLWAWRRGRIRTIRRLVSLVLAVLPFEPALYRAAGVPVEFVGHPVVDALAGAPSRDAARRELGVAADTPLIGLLPGSRRGEIARVLPVMRDAAARVRAARPDVRFAIGVAPTIERRLVADLLGGSSAVDVMSDRAYVVMRAADVLLMASGTATLEAALLGTPMIACYRLSLASEALAWTLTRVPWMTLPNLTLGWRAVPELYRRTTTVERLTAETLRLLDDPVALAAQRAAFAELHGRFGEPGVGARAAGFVLAAAGVRS